MKKWLVSIAAVLVLLLLLPGQAQASELVDSGVFGDFTWTLDTAGTLTLSGSGIFDTGELWNGSPDDPWYSYQNNIRTLVVTDGITGLYGDVLSGWKYVEEIYLPSSLIYLEDGVLPWSYELEGIWVDSRNPSFCTADLALYTKDMTKLLRFPADTTGTYTIPQTVTSIGTGAFYSSKLTEVVLPADLTDIDDGAFLISEIARIQLPEGLTQIGNSAFGGCMNLTAIEIPGSVVHIGDDAFEECKYLENVIIHEGIEYIGESAFFGCYRLNEITIPGSLKHIGSYAFYYCDLEKLTLTDGVASIGNAAFMYTDLRSVYIPASVLYIGADAFDQAPLEEFTVSEDNPVYSSVGLALLSKDQTRLIRYLDWYNTGSYTVPKTVTQIHDRAFYFCTDLREVKLPNSLVRIGDQAFSECYALTHIEFPKSLKYLGDQVFFSSDSLSTLFFLGSAPTSEGSPFGTFDPEFEFWDPRLYATVYYPADDPSWTQEARDALGGVIEYVPYDNPFRDLSESSFCYVPVIWAVENGITNGLSADQFGPGAVCNRAQVVTFLWRAAGSPEPENTAHPFVDVKEGAYYYKATLWAVENGITTGTDETHFSPNAPCNRATVVTFIWRAKGQPEPASDDNPFVDVNAASWFGKAVLWAVEDCITNGLSGTTFGPTSNCNRAQVVTFLYRAYC